MTTLATSLCSTCLRALNSDEVVVCVADVMDGTKVDKGLGIEISQLHCSVLIIAQIESTVCVWVGE